MLDIDFTDLKQVVKACKEYGNSEMPFCGTNNDGEHVVISVFDDRIVVDTLQSNGWTRQNVYWTDGTVEELYKK